MVSGVLVFRMRTSWYQVFSCSLISPLSMLDPGLLFLLRVPQSGVDPFCALCCDRGSERVERNKDEIREGKY